LTVQFIYLLPVSNNVPVSNLALKKAYSQFLHIEQIILNLISYFAPMRAIFVCMNLFEENIKEIAKIAAEKYGFFLIDTILRGKKAAL